MKEFISPFLFTLIGFICSLMMFNQCQPINSNKHLESSLKSKFEALEVKAIKHKAYIDTLKKKTAIAENKAKNSKTKYIHIRDSIVRIDTFCLAISRPCDTLIANYEKVIFLKDSTIHQYDTLTAIKDMELANNKLQISLLTDSIPKVYKAGKKRGRKVGFIAGVIITEAANIGAKLVP